MAGRDQIVAYANEVLEVERWPEFAPAGLQVVGSPEVELVVCGVSNPVCRSKSDLRPTLQRRF